MSCLVCVCVCVYMMSAIHHVSLCRNEEVSANGSPTPSRVPRSNISPGVSICALFGLTTAWALYSPNDVLAKEPRLFMVAVGIIFSNITVSQSVLPFPLPFLFSPSSSPFSRHTHLYRTNPLCCFRCTCFNIVLEHYPTGNTPHG